MEYSVRAKGWCILVKRCQALFSIRATLCLLLLFSLLLSCAPVVQAETLSGTCGKEGRNLNWTLDEYGVLTISGEGDMADFPENSTRPWPTASVRSLVLTEGVTSIGNFAFFGCRHMESVSFPETLQSIGTRAFFYCSRLRSVELPDGLTALGENPFAHCSVLEYISVGSGNSVLSVCDGALLSFSDARMIWCPNGSALTDFAVPEGIRTIDDYAFAFCRSLYMVELPESLVSIGARAFDGCSALCALKLPASLREIGNQAFADCTGLRSLTIPEGVAALGPYTFARCSGLSSVIVPDSVTAISETAFYRCFSLELTVGSGSVAERFCLAHDLPHVSA